MMLPIRVRSALRHASAWACPCLLFGLATLPLAGIGSPAVTPGGVYAPVNDTGQTSCVKPDGWHLSRHCSGTGQDAAFGHDAGTGGGADGHAGFSFVKLDATGHVLPRAASDWACVHDTVTGLTWESKTHDGGVHDGGARYTYVNDGSPNDVGTLLAVVNAAALCGATDWRVPTLREMVSLVDYSRPDGGPMIDVDWFPDTGTVLHWTSNKADILAGGPLYWWTINYLNGSTTYYAGEYQDPAARLVRGGNKVTDKRWVVQGAEVLDSSSRLIWRRCAEGQNWQGSRCGGTPTIFLSFLDAIDHAQAEAAATGLPWRAPNIKELATLIDTRVQSPAMSKIAFPGFAASVLHSSTHWTNNPVYSWRLETSEGSLRRDFWGGNMVLVRDAP